MEGVVWDECFLLHTKIQCQVLWKGLFTQLVAFHPLTYILSQIPVVCSQVRVSVLPAGKLCLGFSVAGDNAILTAPPCPHGGSSTSEFSLAVLTLQVGGRRTPRFGNSTLCLTTAVYSQLHEDLQAIY